MKILVKMLYHPLTIVFLILFLKGIYSSNLRIFFISLSGLIITVFFHLSIFKRQGVLWGLKQSSPKVEAYLKPYVIRYENILNIVKAHHHLDKVKEISKILTDSRNRTLHLIQNQLEQRQVLKKTIRTAIKPDNFLIQEIHNKVKSIEQSLNEINILLSQIEIQLSTITLEFTNNDVDYSNLNHNITRLLDFNTQNDFSNHGELAA